MFAWSSSSHNCPALQYNVISSNCGDCPSTTAANSVTCSNVRVRSTPLVNTCTHIVQAVVCNEVLGAPSAPITILIKGNCF